MHAFAERAKRSARVRLSERLRREHSEQLVGVRHQVILAFADQAIVRAGACGILGEEHVYLFAEAMLRFGCAFDRDLRFRYDATPLRDDELSEDAKAALIRFWLSANGR